MALDMGCSLMSWVRSAFEDHGRVDSGDLANGHEGGAGAHEQSEKEEPGLHGIGENDGRASALGEADDDERDRHARSVADERADQGLVEDDAVDVAIGGAHGFEGAVLADVVDGGGVDGLRDDYDADDEAEGGGDENRDTGSGTEHPVVGSAGT